MISAISENTVAVEESERFGLDFDFSALKFNKKEWLSLFGECKKGEKVYIGITVIRKSEYTKDENA